jgi:hypothetical protein
MRWERHVAHIGERRSEYGVVWGKPERKTSLIRPVCVYVCVCVCVCVCGWVDNT